MFLLIGTGVWMTVVLRGLQFRYLAHALNLSFLKKTARNAQGDISNFQALMAALSSTVGVGNIAGVATAIANGGPGALFWMWCTGIVGMATKYAESLLAVHYRQVLSDGSMGGGPMYYIERGLGQKWLAVCFACFTVLASFGIGNMTQSNAIVNVLAPLEVNPNIWGLALVVLAGAVILGGIRCLGRVTAYLVPFMICSYGLAVVVILVLRVNMIPEALMLILRSAFTPTAAVGGFAGAAVKATVQYGLSRGLFSNEAGMGSSPIIAAAAKTTDPVSQALVAMTQTFIDTVVVCTLTGLSIVVTGTWTSGLSGPALTIAAFESVFGTAGRLVVSASLILFAYSTLIGWGYYGERALIYLTGVWSIRYYRLVFLGVIWLGATLQLQTVWTLSDIFNGLMAFPNLVAVMCMTPLVISETRRYITLVKLKPVE